MHLEDERLENRLSHSISVDMVRWSTGPFSVAQNVSQLFFWTEGLTGSFLNDWTLAEKEWKGFVVWQHLLYLIDMDAKPIGVEGL